MVSGRVIHTVWISLQDLRTLMERLQVAASERKLLHKRLFGTDMLDASHSSSMADVLHKVESLFQERDNLVSCVKLCHQVPELYACFKLSVLLSVLKLKTR